MAFVFTPAHRGGSGPPLVCLHGFLDTWRSWEHVLGALERYHDVLAPTLAGHAGGPPLPAVVTTDTLPDAVERAMDEAGFETAHLVGNSLGGHLALRLAARGRAQSVVAFAPAGGWARDDESFRELLARQRDMQRSGVVVCPGAPALVEVALRDGYELDAERITCPVRVVWGLADEMLPWPAAAARYREEWLPHADWIELDGVGHLPQQEIPLETAQLILGLTRPAASRSAP